ncbi:FAD-dependent monooxygenase [Fodinicola feengrottensis]|uniref:FAD-dependent monooxygenase n=1 Tax=Fodinicola feengrottensis TaxID=435914 RepID=UPI00244342BB|nr:FAD-dependent monooxygenase [Fodinicola feengrottensis]
MNRSVLISGAGIGGPTLAFWLARYGYAVTVVEQASQLRASGSAVDFRGDQLALLERMGILDDLRACESHMGDLKIVDGTGKHVSTLPAMLFSGELEIDRGDLAQILYHHTKDHTEYVFGDRITALTQHEHGVDVTFERSAPRTFGLGHRRGRAALGGTPAGVRRRGAVQDRPRLLRGLVLGPEHLRP